MTDKRPEATEGAERKAKELGVDLTTVQGTGKEGKITVEDVQRKHEQNVNSGREESIHQNGEIEKAAEVIWNTFVQLEATRRESTQSDTPLDQNHINIINQYDILRIVMAGPSGPEEDSDLPKTPPDFEPISGKNFAPKKPLADWKPLPQPYYLAEK